MRARALAGLALGFAAGFLAVLVFHQPLIGIFRSVGLGGNQPYSLAPVPPLGVPRVISLAFWGGVWGIVFALLRPFLPDRRAGLLIAGLVFGALAPTAFGWFVLGSGVPAVWWRGPVINGTWGLGTAILILALDRVRQR
jgi:hypothetical protein